MVETVEKSTVDRSVPPSVAEVGSGCGVGWAVGVVSPKRKLARRG